MTNKVELVSVPRELLENISAWLERANQNSDADIDECLKVRALLSAPAEDFRAVVEEPVPFGYWRVPFDLPLQGSFLLWESKGPWGNSNTHIATAIEAGFKITKLYRRPHRPVVLPRRRPKTELGIYSLEDEGYNACLDDIARLNK
ncbi:hypothetical protein OKW98_16745 [Pseudomonas sp. KU26590]|uniref:hypothetical protein n=1 Tax=Pseudomonas sp. KU26590 TaxID=2991051 RepID=UPI00223D930B|nr:hypothetical protein [Pseudomonas sp. KU26590]UZJ58251.1 hypothetical protein OKW98_16745 [Pseudomonas sp. KU26590]